MDASASQKMPNISTSQIQAFLTLASTLNFTKAAVLLHTTQPNLSKTIVNLEDELQVKLFVRNKRSVRLTSAGEVFEKEIEKFMEQYYTAVQRTKYADCNSKSSLSIAVLGTAVLQHLPKVVAQFQEKYPDIPISIADYSLSNIEKSLRDNNADVALVPESELAGFPSFNKVQFISDDMCVVVNANNPLAQRESVRVEELADEALVIPGRDSSPADFKMISNIFKSHGITPAIVSEPNSLNSLILMVESGMGISILAEHMKQFTTANVAFVKLEGYENFFKIACIWKNEYNDTVSDFLEIVHDYVEETDNLQRN